MSTGRSHNVDRLGRFTPKPMALEPSSPPAMSASWSPASRRSTARRSATPSRSRTARRPRRCRASSRSSRACSPGCFPVNSEDYEKFRDALAKLRLNDSALHYEPEVSGGARLRLSLRLPRPAAHGHRAGAPRARVPARRWSPARPTVVYEVHAHRRHASSTSTTRPSCRRSTRSRRSASRSSSPTSWCRPITSARCSSCATTSAARRRRCCTSARRCRCSTSCRSPKWCSISSTA